MATIGFDLRGEGTTADEATARLRDQAKTMRQGIAGLLQNAKDYHSSAFQMAQVRSKDCDANNYGQARLSTGPCAITGYVATLPMTVDTSRVADVGTLVGLVSRLGGLNAAVRGFWLRDDTAARRQAMQAALDNAYAQAALIATGAGAKLGPVLRVQDGDYREVTLTTAPAQADMTPPPPSPPPPIRVDLAPEPIQTVVRIMAVYAIDR